jgi:hypothetical protein
MRHQRNRKRYFLSLSSSSTHRYRSFSRAVATSSRCLLQRTRAHLRARLHLLQHCPGRGLQGSGNLGGHSLSRCNCLLQGLHFQTQVPGWGLLRLRGDSGLSWGLGPTLHSANP